MSISPNLKRFILIETREISFRGKKATFNNYDELYYMLQKIIEYDVAEETINGLHERLSYAFNKIVCEKLDRQDIITFFPIVWSKFEAYVKKIMFIVDPDGFSAYALDKKKTLPDYLDRLGISYNVKGDQRTLFTQMIYNATQLRNAESHDCEYWSITKCYKTLGESLLAYLFVTNNCLDRIKAAIQTGNLHSTIPLFSGRRFSIKNLGFFDIWGYSRRFPGVDFDRIKLIKEENGYRQFDENGCLLRDEFTGSDGNTQLCEHKTTCTQTGIIRESLWKAKVKRDEQDVQEKSYSTIENCDKLIARINEENEITSLIFYRQDFKTGKLVPDNETTIEYYPDGSAELYQYHYNKEKINKNGEKTISLEKKLRRIYRFNHYGLLIGEDIPYKNTFVTDVSYIYDDDMHIQRIEYRNKGYYFYETINDCVYIKWHDGITDAETIKETLLFKDKKLIRATSFYFNNADEISEQNTFFEYYSN